MPIGLPVKANYAAGDILTATNMNDLSGTFNSVVNSFGQSAGKNLFINGGFDVWQRGTSGAGYVSSGGYVADRWQGIRGAAAAGMTMSRQAAQNTALPNVQYAMRMQRDSGNTSTQDIRLFYSAETVDSIPFAGQAITFSYYVRKGANYSGGNVTGIIYSGTGTDQNLGISGFTGTTAVVTVTRTSATLTTDWTRVQGTATVATNATQLGLLLSYTPTGTAGANDWIEITGMQLEVGSVATPFRRTGGSIQGELAMCQRYYEKSYDITTASGTSTGAGSVYLTQGSDGANNSVYALRFKVEKRNSSWSAAYFTTAGVATVWNYLRSGVGSTGAAITTDLQSTSGARIYLNTGAAWTNNTIQGHWVIDNEL
jgi:hypothetical protein